MSGDVCISSVLYLSAMFNTVEHCTAELLYAVSSAGRFSYLVCQISVNNTRTHAHTYTQDSQRKSQADTGYPQNYILVTTNMHFIRIRGRLGLTPAHVTLSVDVQIWDLGVKRPFSGREQRGSGPGCGKGRLGRRVREDWV